MSEQRQILTQAGLEDVKFDIQQVGENLNEHVNASLSRAHAINIVDGYVDTDGNDRTTYQNSAGNIVGTKQLRFNVGGAIYYAPCNPSADAGQPATTGQVNSGMTEEEFAAVGGSAWTTNAFADNSSNAEEINTDFLLPHTLRKHEEVHGNFSIVAENTEDSAGNIVGNYKVRWVIGNIRYAIPASLRLGGPVQPPRSASMTGGTYAEAPSGGPNSVNIPWTVTAVGGTLPLTYQFQFLNASNAWENITPGVGEQDLDLPNWDPGISYIWTSTSSNVFTVTFILPGSDETRSARFRCQVSNAGGAVVSNTLTFTAKDNTGSWVIYATHDVAPFSFKEMLRLYHLRLWSLEHRPLLTRIYMGAWGKQLVARMREQKFDFRLLRADIAPILSPRPKAERFDIFKRLVKRLFRQFWPDCPDQDVQNELNRVDPE